MKCKKNLLFVFKKKSPLLYILAYASQETLYLLSLSIIENKGIDCASNDV